LSMLALKLVGKARLSQINDLLSLGTLNSAICGHFKTRHSTASKIGYDSSFGTVFDKR
jgi:hypothetical protein